MHSNNQTSAGMHQTRRFNCLLDTYIQHVNAKLAFGSLSLFSPSPSKRLHSPVDQGSFLLWHKWRAFNRRLCHDAAAGHLFFQCPIHYPTGRFVNVRKSLRQSLIGRRLIRCTESAKKRLCIDNKKLVWENSDAVPFSFPEKECVNPHSLIIVKRQKYAHASSRADSSLFPDCFNRELYRLKRLDKRNFTRIRKRQENAFVLAHKSLV